MLLPGAKDKRVVRVQKAFNAGKTRPKEWRVAQIQGIQRMIQDNYDEFKEALKKDLGGSGGPLAAYARGALCLGILWISIFC